MPVAKHFVHAKQYYPQSNGLVQLRYVGLKFPESQWAGLVDGHSSHVTTLKDIGHIVLQAEGQGQFYDIERQLLTMAKMHGAHLVHIDFINRYDIEDDDGEKTNQYVNIYGRCQRYEL